MVQRIKVSGGLGLQRALSERERQLQADLIRMCRRAAEFGRLRAQQHARKAGTRSSGTYERSFVIEPTPTGAVLANAAKHALFVERGRKPGRRPPPVAVILRWMIERGIIKRIPVFNGRAGLAKIRPEIKGRTRRIMVGVLKEVASSRRLSKREAYVAEAWHKALAIARSIGRKGIRGKFPLGKATGDIKRFIRAELVRLRKGG